MKKCEWCNEEKAAAARTAVYWELPDGTKAIENHRHTCGGMRRVRDGLSGGQCHLGN